MELVQKLFARSNCVSFFTQCRKLLIRQTATVRIGQQAVQTTHDVPQVERYRSHTGWTKRQLSYSHRRAPTVYILSGQLQRVEDLSLQRINV